MPGAWGGARDRAGLYLSRLRVDGDALSLWASGVNPADARALARAVQAVRPADLREFRVWRQVVQAVADEVHARCASVGVAEFIESALAPVEER